MEALLNTQENYFSSPEYYTRLVTTIMELYTVKDIKNDDEITSRYILYKLELELDKGYNYICES